MELPAGAISNPPGSMILHEQSAGVGPPSQHELPSHSRSDDHLQEAPKQLGNPNPSIQPQTPYEF